MNGFTLVHHYRVRFPDPGDAAGDPVEVRVTADLVEKTVTTVLPGRPPSTIDVVTARALSMLLGQAVFGSLEPTGPELRVEKDTGDTPTGGQR